jgi:hypothetical protein
MYLRTVLLFLRVKQNPGIIYGMNVESLNVKNWRYEYLRMLYEELRVASLF